MASSRCIRSWHSLVYGQPSYMGQVYQSHPLQDYLPRRWWKDDATRARWQGSHPTTYQKSFPGVEKWEVAAWIMKSTGVSTEDGWRPQVRWFGCRPLEEHIHQAEGRCLYPLMLADSEPKEECYHSLNWVTAGKANQTDGGVKWESSPHVGMESQRSTTPMRNAPTYLREVPTPTMEGWLYTLQSSQAKMTANQKRQSMRSCSLKECGVCAYRPPKTIHLTINRDSCQTHSKLIMTVVHTRKLYVS